MSQSGTFRLKLEALRASHASRVLELVQRLQDAWSQVRAEPELVGVTRVLHELARDLADPEENYEYAGVRIHAQRIEARVEEFLGGAALDWRRIDASIRSLCNLVAPSRRVAAAEDASVAPCARPAKMVYVHRADAAAAGHMERVLLVNGYDVEVCPSLVHLDAAIGRRRPDVVVVDLELAADPGLVARLEEEPIPWFCIAKDAGIEARLEATRGGCAAFFGEPLDLDAVVAKLDALIGRGARSAPRVLVVERDCALTARFDAALLRAGIAVSVQRDPLQLLSSLSEVRPDLLLIELDLPGCSGLELSSVVRQEDAYASVPILFLSDHTRVDEQSLRLEREDCLHEPISPADLVAAVHARLDRARAVRSQTTRDGLTGLLNHAAVIERVDTEIGRARRRESPLAFAMIDVDLFKGINDRHGHPAGDQVLRTLTRFLRQRLRRIDIIGRYGGEEFAVLFPDTLTSDAATTLDLVRDAFTEVVHFHGDDASVTFSAGVAGYPACRDTPSLVAAADLALYEAKRRGRNRVVAKDVDA